MKIKVINGGLMTTVQDRGRYGMQAGGMQVSGCMDALAALTANALVGNEAACAVLEATYLGPELELDQAALVAVTGGEPEVQIDGRPAASYRALLVQPGQRLKIGAQKKGMRAYIAVSGGLAVPEVLGSRSTNLKLKIGGLEGRRLQAGDEIPVGEPSDYAAGALAGKTALRQADRGLYQAALKLEGEGSADSAEAGATVAVAAGAGVDVDGVLLVRAVPGPQEDYFFPEALERLQQDIYTVSNESDRMGYRLEGPAVKKSRQQDLITDGIVFGSIQIPPNGQPIIMLADHQTTGGYPKIATVATVDLPLLAQAMPGTRLRLQLITVQEAQKLLRARQGKLKRLLDSIRQSGESVARPGARARQYKLYINGESFEVSVEPVQS